MQRTGTLGTPLSRQSLPVRFWAKVAKTEGGCWNWTVGTHGNGYGAFKLDGRQQNAHRVAYQLERGPIPDGLQIDHLCRNKRCVNPDHLEPVTAKVNVLRSDNLGALNSRKTHCAQGHPYSGDNLRQRPDRRLCKICHSEQSKRSLRRRREREGKVIAPPLRETDSHCKAGHAMTEANRYTPPSGGLRCRACRNEQAAAYKRRKRAAGDV